MPPRNYQDTGSQDMLPQTCEHSYSEDSLGLPGSRDFMLAILDKFSEFSSIQKVHNYFMQYLCANNPIILGGR